MLLEIIAKGSSDVSKSKQNEYPIFNLPHEIQLLHKSWDNSEAERMGTTLIWHAYVNIE